MIKSLQTLFSNSLKDVYVANIFFSLHSFLILYINSPFIEQYISTKTLGLLFVAGSAVNILIILLAPSIVGRIGARTFALIAIVVEAIAIGGLIFSKTAVGISVFFVVHQAVILLILYLIDLFLEKATRSENYTGRIRSIFLTGSNITLVISPFIAGTIAGQTGNFIPVYIVGLVFLIPLFVIISTKIPNDGISNDIPRISKNIWSTWKNKNIRGVTMCRFSLEFFYAWMVIYMAINLNTNIGFSWPEIGLIFSIMLLPFVLFELPLGAISDKNHGERKIIIIGFLIVAVATAFIPLLKEPVFLYWAILLFITRIGASFVEIGTESYFFKHVKNLDTGVIGIFRLARPLALIVAPAIASTVFIFVSLPNSFFILATFVGFGIISAVSLKKVDTKFIK